MKRAENAYSVKWLVWGLIGLGTLCALMKATGGAGNVICTDSRLLLPGQAPQAMSARTAVCAIPVIPLDPNEKTGEQVLQNSFVIVKVL